MNGNSAVRVLGVVTARGGSKGIPRKNLAPLSGRPLIAYTIEAALRSGALDRLMVSTDDPEIANVSLALGAEVPFLRPAELSGDHAPSVAVVVHAARWLDSHEGYRPDYVLLLQPTSPLRTAEDIASAVRLAVEKDADCVISVYKAKEHPYWMKTVDSDGRMADFMSWDRIFLSSRQHLSAVYALNGAIYLVRRSVLVEQESLYGERNYAYIMPADRSLDVDTPMDLRVAELYLRCQQSILVGKRMGNCGSSG